MAKNITYGNQVSKLATTSRLHRHIALKGIQVMKKSCVAMTILFFTSLVSTVIAQETGILKDERDGKQYKTVKIGDLWWMAENLNYEKLGTCYKDDINNCKKYGKLFSGEEAKQACPSGWHLPSTKEFITLINYYGGEGKFSFSNIISDKSEFNALLAGRHHLGKVNGIETEDRNTQNEILFAGLGGYAYFGAYPITHDKAYGCVLELNGYYRYALISWSEANKAGISIRCVKDNALVTANNDDSKEVNDCGSTWDKLKDTSIYLGDSIAETKYKDVIKNEKELCKGCVPNYQEIAEFPIGEEALFQEVRSIDMQFAYREYLKQYPNGKYSNIAKKRLVWLYSQKAEPEFEYKTEVSQQDKNRTRIFEIKIKFKEASKKIGYALFGSGSIVDSYGVHWTEDPTGTWGINRSIRIKPGKPEIFTYKIYNPDGKYCGGHFNMDWQGMDDGGNIVKLQTNAYLKCANK